MTRTMYDSTNPSDIPRDAQMVAYYVDGIYAWPRAWIDLFPNSVMVSISAIGAKTAQVGDVEDGCIWPPANAVGWVLRARADGYDPTIYVNERNDWAPTRDAFDARGVAHPHWWVANYDGRQTIPDGAVAKQYAHPPMLGKHYDLSTVADYWPGVDNPKGGDAMSWNEDLTLTTPDGSTETHPAWEWFVHMARRIADLEQMLGDYLTATNFKGEQVLTEDVISATEKRIVAIGEKLDSLVAGTGVPMADLIAAVAPAVAVAVVAEFKKEGN